MGLGSSLERASDGTWIAETPAGRATIQFSDPTGSGSWTTPSSQHQAWKSVPLRVVTSRDAGSEVLLTLFRRPGVSDEKFAADAGGC